MRSSPFQCCAIKILSFFVCLFLNTKSGQPVYLNPIPHLYNTHMASKIIINQATQSQQKQTIMRITKLYFRGLMYLTVHVLLLLCPPPVFYKIYISCYRWFCSAVFTLSYKFLLFYVDTNVCTQVCKLGYTRNPSHLLNLMHALWTHLHPDTLKPNIEGGFSSIALLTTTSMHTV